MQFSRASTASFERRRKNESGLVEFECAAFMRGVFRNCFSVVGPVIACSGRNETAHYRGGERGGAVGALDKGGRRGKELSKPRRR